jgi:HlyD family secretion protein
MANKRYLIAAGAALLLIAGGIGAYTLRDSFTAQPTYRLGKVDRGGITSVVSATGTLNPVVSVQVGSQVSGQVKELYVDFNSQVKKGEVIARLDRSLPCVSIRRWPIWRRHAPPC